MGAKPVLCVGGLVVDFPLAQGALRAVDGVSYEVMAGETLALVGESGSGKSASVLAAVGLLPAARTAGSVVIDGLDFLHLDPRTRRRQLGRLVAVIFQDPAAALNPVMTVGAQLTEALAVHNPRLGAAALRTRAIELLRQVEVPEPALRFRQYPHQFSGGMAQRAMIAIAIANRPRLLIADEPTTALDVTIQAQLLHLLRQAQIETGAATLLITHDLGVVAELADRVAVMYAGRIVELGTVHDVFARPAHPYTVALLRSLPRVDSDDDLQPIPGTPPDMRRRPPGCAFEPRCFLGRGRTRCQTEPPPLAGAPHRSACHFRNEL
ncbi:MAG: ABC transporter ATP-binding protein [Acidisphaera sp.]|nr:ABC transporter ATP-binding protein [Acidisphaera sp.]